jgi:PPP family 3-phenylpropionic acid transporter
MANAPYEVIAIQILHCVTFGGYYYIGTQLTSNLIPQHTVHRGKPYMR